MSIERIAALNAQQVEQLHAFYNQEWWTQGRSLEDVHTLLAHSDLIFAYAESDTGALAAFARVLTDRVVKALIFDIIVDPSQRGQNLGRRVMDDIFAAPELAQVRHFELYCAPEMAAFYQKWGFSDELGDLSLMRHVRTSGS